jgi:hypothetical protein
MTTADRQRLAAILGMLGSSHALTHTSQILATV